MAHYDLDGRVALITGGGRGIGLGLAQALVRRGAAVALVDLDPAAAQRAAEGLGGAGVRAIGLGADVTDRPAIDQAVAETVRRLGGIDVVVANAGIANVPAPVRVIPSAEFERVVEVDLLGVYRTVAAAMDQIVARQGQAVLVSSIYAFANGMMAAPYAVAKAGVEQLGRALRVELSVHGASATVAYFGFVDTVMVQQAFDQGRARSGREPGEYLPAFMLKPITPAQAGEALARGIERRRSRVIAPRWWAIGSVLRGLLNPPADYLSAHSSRVHGALRDSEAGAVAVAAHGRGGAADEASKGGGGAGDEASTGRGGAGDEASPSASVPGGGLAETRSLPSSASHEKSS